MKNNARSLSPLSALKLTAVKKAKSTSSEQIKSAYLKAILSGSRIVSDAEKELPVENPDRMAAIRYIRDSATIKKK
ncbi:MAG: hypothetical protein HYZ15_14945 [Sphingobacteriales bacterium]|nr:hypothetical protein [Sphingobacteriales bacterium]